MQFVLLDRPNLAKNIVVALATVTALAVLSLVAAYWTWVWLAPGPVPRAPAATGGSGQSATALFGTASQERMMAAPTGIAIRLLGIVAATAGRQGYAVLELEPRQILAVNEGEDVAPGLRLAEVGFDHVTLERNGKQEILTWPDKTKAPEPVPLRSNR